MIGRILLIHLIALLVTLNLSAQTYTYKSSVGNVPFTSDLRSYLVMVYQGPKDNVLSNWQTLPFDWNFYGEKVEGYFISDNGYVTFDPDATQSIPDNTTLPNLNAPRNAIFTFWDDMKIDAGTSEWANCVRTATVGVAPNRIHIIYWIGFSPKGVPYSNSNTISWLLAIYEQGDFDIIYVAGRKTVTMNATIGCQNSDATSGVMVSGSPNIDYFNLTADPNDDITYSFSFSDRKADADLSAINVPHIIKAGEELSFDVTVRNVGSDNIQSYKVFATINDGKSEKTVEKVVASINLAVNQENTQTFSNVWTADNPGNFIQIKLRIEDVMTYSGESDNYPENDTLSANIFEILGISSDKRVLVEQFTGAWCGWCPDGSLKMIQIKKDFPKADVIAIHAGGTDQMIIEAGAAIAGKLSNGYPSGLVDRIRFKGQSHTALQRELWIAKVQERLTDYSPVSISLEFDYNKETRLLKTEVDLNFSDYPYPGDLRINLWLVEDKIVGTGSGYDQANYYSNNSKFPDHPYYSLPNPIRNYEHRLVLRESLTGTWGESIEQPTNLSAEYKESFDFTLPSNYNDSRITLLAFLGYNNNPIYNFMILNSLSVPIDETTSASETIDISSQLGFYPNPVSKHAEFTLELEKEEFVKMVLYNSSGIIEMILKEGLFAPGKHRIILNASLLPNGLYYYSLTQGKTNKTGKLIILR